MPRISRAVILFVLGLAIYLYFSLIVNRDLFWGDERAFTIAGYFWVKGIITGQKPEFFVQGWTLQRTSDSPPLSKLITGVLIQALTPLGLGRFPVPIRIHCSILLSGTGVICYLIARRLGDEKTGLLAWLMAVLQPVFQPDGPYLILSSLDITCIFFTSISVFLLLKRDGRSLLLSGVFFGLASLSKYVAIAILPPFILTWSLLTSKQVREAIRNAVFVIAVGLSLHIALNPMLTIPSLRETMINWQIREGNVFFHWSGDEILMLRAFFRERPLDVALIRFILKIFSLPISFIAGYYLMLTTLISIFYAGYMRIQLSRREIFPLLWFAFTFFFLGLHWKHHSYYKVLLFPALAVFNAIFWTNRFGLGKNAHRNSGEFDG